MEEGGVCYYIAHNTFYLSACTALLLFCPFFWNEISVLHSSVFWKLCTFVKERGKELLCYFLPYRSFHLFHGFIFFCLDSCPSDRNRLFSVIFWVAVPTLVVEKRHCLKVSSRSLQKILICTWLNSWRDSVMLWHICRKHNDLKSFTPQSEKAQCLHFYTQQSCPHPAWRFC